MGRENIVIVDDVRTPLDLEWSTDYDFVVLRTSEEALSHLQMVHHRGEHVDELWLDYDLGYDETKSGWVDTTMPVVRWLQKIGHAGTPLDVDLIFIHTQTTWAPIIVMALRPYYTVVRATFLW